MAIAAPTDNFIRATKWKTNNKTSTGRRRIAVLSDTRTFVFSFASLCLFHLFPFLFRSSFQFFFFFCSLFRSSHNQLLHFVLVVVVVVVWLGFTCGSFVVSPLTHFASPFTWFYSFFVLHDFFLLFGSCFLVVSLNFISNFNWRKMGGQFKNY